MDRRESDSSCTDSLYINICWQKTAVSYVFLEPSWCCGYFSPQERLETSKLRNLPNSYVCKGNARYLLINRSIFSLIMSGGDDGQ